MWYEEVKQKLSVWRVLDRDNKDSETRCVEGTGMWPAITTLQEEANRVDQVKGGFESRAGWKA
jgi:hypothetical protein